VSPFRGLGVDEESEAMEEGLAKGWSCSGVFVFACCVFFLLTASIMGLAIFRLDGLMLLHEQTPWVLYSAGAVWLILLAVLVYFVSRGGVKVSFENSSAGPLSPPATSGGSRSSSRAGSRSGTQVGGGLFGQPLLQDDDLLNQLQ
jgi:hypothetical protein